LRERLHARHHIDETYFHRLKAAGALADPYDDRSWVQDILNGDWQDNLDFAVPEPTVRWRPVTRRSCEAARYVGAMIRWVIDEHVDAPEEWDFRVAIRTLIYYIATKTSLQPTDFDSTNGLAALIAIVPLAFVGRWWKGNELVGGGRDTDVIHRSFGDVWDEVKRFAE
jgi:hypothetical protein